MPQHLTPAWINALGPAAEEIHSTWLHRLANLTLTGYNSSLSNSTFQEKRDAEDGGYKSSGLRMNQVISQKDSWGLPELQERGQTMVEDATKKIWLMPVTSFVPEQKEFDSCSLDDENYDLTGRDIVKYSYQNKETPVTSWADMYEHVIKYLHNKDKSVLLGLAYSSSESTDLWNYFSIDEGELRIALKIDDQIYAEKNTSTALKISVLRRLFALYKEDPMDLVFYLRDQVAEKVTDESRHDLRRRYWKQAIPEIRKANFVRGCFDNCNPISGNWIVGSFGIGGFGICCIANYDEARIDFSLSKGEAEKNKEAFDFLYSHKDEIESALGSEVEWLRSESTKGSYIIHRLSKVSITNEADWPRMIDYHAEWSKRFGDVIIPYLKELYPSVEDYDAAMKFAKAAQMFQNWVSEREESTSIVTDFDKCNRIYTRFKTEGMTKIFPDAKGTKSGWATENHYFYEIVNCSGNSFYIQLAISFKELPEDQRKICELIEEQLPARKHRDNWSWWVPFRTKKVSFDEDESQEGINALLDKYFESIVVYEKELMEKLLV